MRTSYVERLGRFLCFRCVAIVLDASSIVKIEVSRWEPFGRSSLAHGCGHPFLLQFMRPHHSIVATGGRAE
jgi:hypothetical protein